MSNKDYESWKKELLTESEVKEPKNDEKPLAEEKDYESLKRKVKLRESDEAFISQSDGTTYTYEEAVTEMKRHLIKCRWYASHFDRGIQTTIGQECSDMIDYIDEMF